MPQRVGLKRAGQSGPLCFLGVYDAFQTPGGFFAGTPWAALNLDGGRVVASRV